MIFDDKQINGRHASWRFPLVLAFAASLAACGGGSGDDTSDSGGGLDDTIADADVRSVTVSLAVPPAGTRSSSVPGQRMGTLVSGATVTVEVIQPDGSSQQVEATVEDLGNGQYEINLPPDAAGLRSDCIIVAATEFNGDSITLRAPFVATNINVNAASEFLIQELNTTGRNFANISIDELRNQLTNVQGFAVPEDSDGTVEDILEALETAIGGDVRDGLAEAERENIGPGDAAVFAGRYNGGFLELGFEGAPEGGFGRFEVDNAQQVIELAASSPDELRVTRFEFREAGLELENNANGASLGTFSSDTFADENDFAADYRVIALDDGSFVFPTITTLEVDQEPVSSQSPEAELEVFRDYRFFPSGDGQVFFATFATNERTFRAVDTNDDGISDSADLSDKILQGYDRDISVLIRQPSTPLQASDFTGDYVLVVMEAGAEQNGTMFALTETNIVSMNNGTVTFPTTTGFEIVKRNGQVTFSEDPNDGDTKTITANGNGAITLTGGGTDQGYASEGGAVIYIPFDDDYDQGTPNAGMNVGHALLMRVPESIPSGLNGKKYRLQLLELGFDGDGQSSEFSGIKNGEITFSGEGAAATMTIDRTQDFIRRDSDTSVPVLESETEQFVFSAGQTTGKSGLRYIDGDAELELYFAADLGLILMRYKEGGEGDAFTSMLVATPIN